MKANTAAAQGFEEISRAWFAFTQDTLEQGVSATKAVLTAMSLREVMDLQSGYTKTAFDSVVAEGARLSEIGVKLTNEALAPLSERVNAPVAKYGSSEERRVGKGGVSTCRLRWSQSP